MGGLTVATVLTIFFVPALYAAWFRVKRAKDTGRHAEAHAPLPAPAPAPAH
jgi:multidrug efflux pump